MPCNLRVCPKSTQPNVHESTHKHRCIYTCIYVRTSIHTQKNAYISTQKLVYIFTYMYIYVRTYIRTYTHTYIHKGMHAHVTSAHKLHTRWCRTTCELFTVSETRVTSQQVRLRMGSQCMRVCTVCMLACAMHSVHVSMCYAQCACEHMCMPWQACTLLKFKCHV